MCKGWWWKREGGLWLCRNSMFSSADEEQCFTPWACPTADSCYRIRAGSGWKDHCGSPGPTSMLRQGYHGAQGTDLCPDGIARVCIHRWEMDWSFCEHSQHQGTPFTLLSWFLKSTYSLPDSNLPLENYRLHSTSFQFSQKAFDVVWYIRNSDNFPLSPPSAPNTRYKYKMGCTLESRQFVWKSWPLRHKIRAWFVMLSHLFQARFGRITTVRGEDWAITWSSHRMFLRTGLKVVIQTKIAFHLTSPS